MDSIFHRVSIRKFQDKPVEPEKIEKLLRAAMAAPSAGNQQPWEFYVVTNRDLIQKLAATSPYTGCAKNAPVLIVSAYREDVIFPMYAQIDLSIANENLWLETDALGLGGVWLGFSAITSLLVCGGVGVMFIILGNFMPNIKQNYTFGCRTPWALNDEHNWQRTQRMGGITFVVMGIALIAVAFLAGLLGDTVTLILLLCAVCGGSAWIYLYSYLVYVGKMK